MALSINGRPLAGPVSVDINTVSVALHNVAKGGTRRFVVSTNVSGKAAHSLRFSWVDLTQAEADAVEDAWLDALAGYVTLIMDGLKIMSLATTNTVSVTVMPETGMTITMEQAFGPAGGDALLYNVEAVFLSMPISVQASY